MVRSKCRDFKNREVSNVNAPSVSDKILLKVNCVKVVKLNICGNTDWYSCWIVGAWVQTFGKAVDDIMNIIVNLSWPCSIKVAIKQKVK